MGDWNSGRDAASIKPKFVPDDELRPRDNSGGIDWSGYSAQFGDGGYVTGAKDHLSASPDGSDMGSLEEERREGRRGNREGSHHGMPDTSNKMSGETAKMRSERKRYNKGRD